MPKRGAVYRHHHKLIMCKDVKIICAIIIVDIMDSESFGRATDSLTVVKECSGCIYILSTGKNKGLLCGSSKIYCRNMCLRHHKKAPSLPIENNYGNPEQAHLWVKWVMSVQDEI